MFIEVTSEFKIMRTLLFSALLCVCGIVKSQSIQSDEKWTAIHLLNYTCDEDLMKLSKKVPALAEQGINMIFLEVDYSFEFESHPELIYGEKYITRGGAKYFAKVCKKNGVRLIPQFQSFGHQSWAENTFSLLTKYPELDLTPGAYPGNEGIYCREWDPNNPKVNELVFPLIDEIVDAFGADGIHVGMDEIFLISDSNAISTKDQNPGKVFAKVVNEFREHFVGEKGIEMFIWGDRLIDANVHKYGEWEASMNETHTAIDLIPKDIIICDWHYEPRPAYTSINMFLDKGFKVLPCSFRKTEGVESLVMYSYRIENKNMLGHMFTTWGHVKKEDLLDFPAMKAGLSMIREKRFYDVSFELLRNEGTSLQYVKCIAPDNDLKVYYSIDGSDPDHESNLYQVPIALNSTVTIKAVAYKEGKPAGSINEQTFLIHKGSGKKIRYESAFSIKYPTEDGARTLINGKNGTHSFADGQWLGFEGQNLEAVIHLGKSTAISKVSLNSFNDPRSWIHHTDKVEVYVSNDDETFEKVGELSDIDSKELLVNVEVPFKEVKAEFVKVVAHKRTIPAGYPGEGSDAWIFVDELVIE